MNEKFAGLMATTPIHNLASVRMINRMAESFVSIVRSVLWVEV